MIVQELTPQLAQQLGIDRGTAGVVITDVSPDGPASEAGLRPGDIVTEVNRHAVKDLKDYQQALKTVKSGENLLLLVKRGSGAIYVELSPTSKNQ